MITVRPLEAEDVVRWDAFVDSMEHGTIFHKLGWKRIIESTFRYESNYILVEEDHQIRGVLPLFHLKSPFAGNAVISTPFAVYGGILAAHPELEQALLDSCKSYLSSRGASYAELRHTFPCQSPELKTRDTLYFTFLKPLHATAEQNFESLPREARRLVRKAEKNGLTAKFVDSGVDDFYEIYASSVHNLGTPVFPKSLFTNCLREMKHESDLLLIYHENKPVAGVLSFYYRKTVLPYYGGSLPDKNHLAPNNFMYWTLMKHASEKGCHWFDFGRSKNTTGAFDFKRHMGFEPTALPYQYWMANGHPLPDINPLNPKFRLAINVWRKLPLGVTKFLGPKLVRAFP